MSAKRAYGDLDYHFDSYKWSSHKQKSPALTRRHVGAQAWVDKVELRRTVTRLEIKGSMDAKATA